jgi:Rrf2 family protein
MSRIITLSEAGFIAIHSMVLIARSDTMLNAATIAINTGSSRHHVSKVVQRLVKGGYLHSTRGPSGGFILARPADNITLLEVYESIEGPISTPSCPIESLVCPFDKCLMSNIIHQLSTQLKQYLHNHKVSDFAHGPK